MAALKRVSDEPYVCGFELHDIHDIANLERRFRSTGSTRSVTVCTSRFSPMPAR